MLPDRRDELSHGSREFGRPVARDPHRSSLQRGRRQEIRLPFSGGNAAYRTAAGGRRRGDVSDRLLRPAPRRARLVREISRSVIEGRASRRRAVIRTIVVCFFAALTLVSEGSDIVLPWHPLSTYGFGFTGDTTIHGVIPGGPAAKAGIQDGDRVVLSSAPFRMRVLADFLYTPSTVPENPLTFQVERGNTFRTVTLRATVQERSPADNLTDVILILS